MPKRKSESKEDRWLKKFKKYEEKLRSCRNIPTEDELNLPYAFSPARARARAPTRSPSSARSPYPVRSPTPRTTPPREGASNWAELSPRACSRPQTASPATGAPLTADAAPPPPPLTGTDPNTSPTDAPATDAIPADPDLLQALGDYEVETEEWGRDIIGDLVKRWTPILKDGIKKEEKQDLTKKYLFPKNCPLLRPPSLNPEIGAMLTESARNRDTRLLKKQSQLGCALTVLGRTMSDILTKSIDTPEILRRLTDAGKLLADSHFSETETRRSLITPMVDKCFIEPFKDRKRDSNLFGDKLGDFIKSSRVIQKTGKLIQSATSVPNHLNSRGPPPSSRQQQQRTLRTQLSRGRGGGKMITYSRRTPAQPAPPTTRAPRAYSPPPPPPRHKQAAVASNRRKQ